MTAVSIANETEPKSTVSANLPAEKPGSSNTAVSYRGVGSTDDCLETTSTSYPDSSASSSTRHRPPSCFRRLAVPILVGQILSALIAVTGISSTYLVNFGVSLPITQNLPPYVILSIVYGLFAWSRLLNSHRAGEETFGEFMRTRGWKYFVAGTVDMHANWAIVSAYNYTNITSVQLLDCLAIPTAMVLSRIFLKTRYKWMHVVGVIVCLVGAGMMVGADYIAAKDTNTTTTQTAPGAAEIGSNVGSVLLGDFLVILGATGYGASNVAQEYLVRRYGIIDYLGFAFLSATLWTLIHCLCWEMKTIHHLVQTADKTHTGAALGCLLGFALAMFILYSLFPIAFSRSNAVLVNLSLLTADIYALVVGLFLFGRIFHYLYLGAFAAILVGIFVFASRDPVFMEALGVADAKDDDTE